jgi:WD40 repeat protein
MALKLASGSYDGTIKFWDPSTGTNNPSEEIKLAKLNLIPNRIEVSGTKEKLVVGMSNTCRIYDLTKPDTLEHSFDGFFKGNVTAVGFRKNDKLIYTAC